MPSNDNSSTGPLGVFSDQYTIEQEVGRGGAGRVFLAYDGNIGREVAIKEVDVSRTPAEDIRVRRKRRFIREAKVTGQLEHPGIVPIYDFAVRPDGTSYYVMKYVRGTTLSHAVKQAPSPTPEEGVRNRLRNLDCLIAVCEAIAYAHSKGIIHRDLKPGNVVVGEFGETIILDWGLAKKIGEEDDVAETEDTLDEIFDDNITRQGALLGTPSFMAPEQADPTFGAVDQQSDVYSLGAMLFFVLTGERIYEPGGRGSLEKLADDEPTPSPRVRNKFIPPELAAICEKATAKEKASRFKDAREMAQELRAYRDGRLVSVYAYSRGELFKRFVSRNRAAVIIAAALVISVVIGAGITTNFAIEANRARQRAERALVEISNISDKAMSLARGGVETLEPYVETFSDTMTTAAHKLSRLRLQDAKRVNEVLEWLHKEHAKISSFAIVRPSLEIAATFPADFAPKLDRRTMVDERIDKVFEKHAILLGNVVVIDGVRMFAISVPIMRRGKVEAVLSAFMRIHDIMPAAFGFNPADSPFQVWCMQDDGYILYDEDPTQIGKDLFADDMYERFPELQQFGKRMQVEPWGAGYYSFFDRGGERIVYKIAAWDTVKFSENVSWKMVVTHPYIVER